MAEEIDTLARGPLPPATFRLDVDLARHFIGLLAELQGKTESNIGLKQQRRLNNTATGLQFSVVQAAR